MAVDYEVDTLACARNNRVASQRFYNQVMTPSRTFFVQDLPVMLHRSPSGAKRKIRQRREEQGSRPSPFLPASASSSNQASPATSIGSNYRSLIDSGGYQSILPDFDSSFVPVTQPRLNSTFSTSMSSLDITNTSLSSSSTPPPPPHTKPTVEVHPMPNEERIMALNDAEMRKEKPMVPAKPKNLKVDHLNSLIGTPSSASFQQTCNASDRGSHELKKVDEKQIESIGPMSRRARDFEGERSSVDDDISANERNGECLLSVIEKHDLHLANKIRRHIEHFKELLRFEMKLRCLLEKVVDRIRSGDDETEALLEEARLRRRLSDVNFLRMTYARRERDLECAMSRFFEEEESRQWHFYKDTLVQLVQNEEHIRGSVVNSKGSFRSKHIIRQSPEN
ncbi:unnamed protein product [Angiostrongylus costaricensis]|uniref:ASD2 domain-containing protein n=1 Tax=Angiostrongylus costaricensis TaxID=334426 RepID=A0A0R3PRD7_ANGCS|nr:unnamed protein product [Angiostrongylus costaricensis]